MGVLPVIFSYHNPYYRPCWINCIILAWRSKPRHKRILGYSLWPFYGAIYFSIIEWLYLLSKICFFISFLNYVWRPSNLPALSDFNLICTLKSVQKHRNKSVALCWSLIGLVYDSTKSPLMNKNAPILPSIDLALDSR